MANSKMATFVYPVCTSFDIWSAISGWKSGYWAYGVWYQTPIYSMVCLQKIRQVVRMSCHRYADKNTHIDQENLDDVRV